MSRGRRALKNTLADTGLLNTARWIRNGLWTLRFARPNSRYWGRPAPDGLPIPPFALRILVAASPDIGWFLDSGQRGFASIQAAIARAGVQASALDPILDFGCGCGRVTRHWADTGLTVHGTDYNHRLVEWCRRRLRFAAFALNDIAPPLHYADGQFGLVYALSVFTHLHEALQRDWIRELRRVIRPGGFLLLTTHGERYLNELSEPERHRFRAGGLVIRRDDEAGANVCGAYHPEAYVRDHLAEGFAVADFEREGALGNPFQDRWLLRRI